jgi:hypothetical protein
MAASPPPIAHAEAHVAPNTQHNALRPSLTFTGALLWPAFLAPDEDTPTNHKARSGTLLNHWHYTPGKLNAPPAAPSWTVKEVFKEAEYAYDKRFPGVPLPRIDVDLFTMDVESDLGDYAKFSGFYDELAEVRAPLSGDRSTRPDRLQHQKFFDALVASVTADDGGRFAFNGLRAGEYLLFLRGRLSFVEINNPGGEVAPPPTHQHNGVETAALIAAQGAHRLFVKIKIDANGAVQLLARKGGADTPFNTDRLLDPRQKIADMTAETPFRFYVLPLAVKSNAVQWTACAEELGHAFNVTSERARATMDDSAILDIAALRSFPCADRYTRTDAIPGDDALDDLLKRTLLLGGSAADQRTMAFDHVYWCFRAVNDTTKKRGRFVPLDTAGFFSGVAPLYRVDDTTKDSYGRVALRFLDPALDGWDVRELKTRLILWGDKKLFIDMRDNFFDASVRDALIRWKCDQEVFRLRVDKANGINDAESIITTILDADTYRKLDEMQPSVHLEDVASRAENPDFAAGLLSEKGYERLLLYAAEHALRRLAPKRFIHLHSCIRTLAHNRYVYLGGDHELNWFLASSALAQPASYAGFDTRIKGEKGRDHSNHSAGAPATHATVRYELPRGTYRGETGAEMAADYSRHTTGQAIDFDLDRHGNATQKEAAVQWDTNAMLLFGAHRGPSHKDGRLWLEPHKDAGHPTWTTTWIHLDTSDLPNALADFVLTDRDALGPRWDASVIVSGTVTQGGSGRLGARVDLVRGGAVVATTYADREGKYSLRLREGAAGAYYQVQARFDPPYPFQPALPAPPVGAPPAAPVPIEVTDLTVAWPGDEKRDVDFVLPTAAPWGGMGAPDTLLDPNADAQPT